MGKPKWLDKFPNILYTKVCYGAFPIKEFAFTLIYSKTDKLLPNKDYMLFPNKAYLESIEKLYLAYVLGLVPTYKFALKGKCKNIKKLPKIVIPEIPKETKLVMLDRCPWEFKESKEYKDNRLYALKYQYYRRIGFVTIEEYNKF